MTRIDFWPIRNSFEHRFVTSAFAHSTYGQLRRARRNIMKLVERPILTKLPVLRNPNLTKSRDISLTEGNDGFLTLLMETDYVISPTLLTGRKPFASLF